ncbi:Fatty acyl-CoA synthetase and RNA processing-associated kinase 1 [Leucoagaricus sp. SymC.cos]|nr:Fatty acyl-CoA synthetase and RNA processing-associated kinase 1 [Leucoagaricus sp. SymC.cos]
MLMLFPRRSSCDVLAGFEAVATMASQAPHHSLQVPTATTMASAANRPVSAAVHSQNSQAQTGHPRRQQRASHSVATSSQQEESSQNSPYHDVFHHPAVEAYMAAHPRRTIPRFGPYLLLQTLGEGEFGKVKLGIHVQWGEEVAVKLIRRGNVDTAVRLSKVEREIEVLRTLKHPNIVRLYDVIETDKYIGIIIEYASGGELFDHILAHRYLKERDAAKLFSQLISGVWYIHQRKIVHRDLKLENLLLDRNRNVIITDFGFANRFEHKADDLMQTSCGSPCYAAPELVISEGLYVGSAVDIWSCGVILYAMLAGYLPFDDDPANPDGDNINLLYKYIVSTPLSFPDYISADARDLLSMMLVPDPTRRANLDSIMRHRWLSAHAGTSRTDGSPNAFGKTVEELEQAALDQHQQRRLAYQRQMRAAAIAQNNVNNANNATSSSHGREATHTGVPPSRSRSAQPEYLYESSADQGVSPPPATVRSNTTSGVPGTPNGTSSASGKKHTYGSPSAHGITSDDPFGPPPAAGSSSLAAGAVAAPAAQANVPPRISEEKQPPSTTTTKGHKQNNSGSTGGGFRHTIQVEYDERNASGSRRNDERRQQQQPSASSATQQQSSRDRRVSGSSTASRPLPVSPPVPAKSILQPQQQSPPTPPAKASSPPPLSSTSRSQKDVPAVNVSTPSAPPTTSSSGTTTASDTAAAKEKGGDTTSSNASATSSIGKTGSSAVSTSTKEKAEKGHKKGRSSVDKFGFSKFFGGSGSGASSNSNSETPIPTPNKGARKSAASLFTASSPDKNADKGSPSSVPSPSPSPGTPGEQEKGEKKKTRRNTLTVMVEPISRTIRGQKTPKNRTATLPVDGTSPNPANATSPGPISANPNANASAASLAPPTPAPAGGSSKGAIGGGANVSAASFSGSVGTGNGGDTNGGEREGRAAGSTNPASTNKAKRVMAWFRTKSKGRDSMGLVTANNNTSYVVDEPDAGVDGGQGQMLGVPQQPELTLTTPTSTTTKIATPQTPVATPGRPKRSASANTDFSVMTFSTTGFVQKFRNSVGVGSPSSSSRDKHPSIQSSTSRNAATNNNGTSGNGKHKHPHEKLRIHHGAVDQTTITTGPPQEVMLHVKRILEGMGVEMIVESEFKFRCVRHKRKKGVVGVQPTQIGGVNGSGSGIINGVGGEEDVAAFTMLGSAASNGVDKRGLPMPSQTSFGATGNMLRGLLMRRQSSQVSSTSTPPPNPASSNTLAFDDETSVVISPSTLTAEGGRHNAAQVVLGETAYGDPSQDAGDEVRFSVELTRIDRLNDTFSLDIRRLKGNLRSYKFLYDTIRQRADLQSLGQ